MPEGLIEVLKRKQSLFGAELERERMEQLEAYFRLVDEHNPLLHLTGPCTIDEFATRHILESIFVLRLIERCELFADIGSGAGLPGIPCLIADPGLQGWLIESKPKKARFLEKAVAELGLVDRATIVNRQFDEAKNPGVDHVFCRALDKFPRRITRLIEWSETAIPVFLAGPALRDELARLKIKHTATLIPQSERRFVFVIENGQRKVPDRS